MNVMVRAAHVIATDAIIGDGIVGLLVFLLALPWKIIFAFTPPPRMMGGWLAFLICLVFIGLLTLGAAPVVRWMLGGVDSALTRLLGAKPDAQYEDPS